MTVGGRSFQNKCAYPSARGRCWRDAVLSTAAALAKLLPAQGGTRPRRIRWTDSERLRADAQLATGNRRCMPNTALSSAACFSGSVLLKEPAIVSAKHAQQPTINGEASKSSRTCTLDARDGEVMEMPAYPSKSSNKRANVGINKHTRPTPKSKPKPSQSPNQANAKTSTDRQTRAF